jgi:hypothetical protein
VQNKEDKLIFRKCSLGLLLRISREININPPHSGLWSQYSFLKSTLSIHNNINIETYPKLRAFLKRKSEGYQATKSKTFTPKEIDEFLSNAPDEMYLATKVRC